MYLQQSALMIEAGFILAAALLVFTLGKSPVFRVDRAGAAIIGAAAMVVCGVITLDDAMRAIDLKTLAILFSMMVVVANLKLAGFFEWIGELVLSRVSSPKGLLCATVIASGVMSAMAINDVICLLFTPVVLLVCRRAACNPLPHLLAVAMASNIGSAATLLGNPQNILIGSLSGLSFTAYFLTASPIAIVGLVLTYYIIGVVYRAELEGGIVYTPARQATVVHRYLIGKSLVILGLILVVYINGVELALSASVGAGLLLITRRVNPNKVYVSIDFNLLVIFAGLFIIVGGVEKSGLMSQLLDVLPGWAMGNAGVFAAFTVLVSNLVSNVPAVLLLKFFVPFEHAQLWWKSLALFSTLAGNLTITGSVANLIVAEIAKRDNIHISAKEYFRAGFPLTIATTAFALFWIGIK